jgi:hypothetical protein
MQINKLEYDPNAHSQAHLQFAQANAQPKIAKELVCLPTLFLPTLKTNFFGNSSALIERILDCSKLITNC